MTSPLNLSNTTFSSSKVSKNLWHCRLGHPNSTVFDQVLHSNNLPIFSDIFISKVCNACQEVKSHQLTFPTSNNVSSSPWELIFTDV